MLLVYIGKEINKDKLLNILNNLNIKYKLIDDSYMNKRVGSILKIESDEVGTCTRKSFMFFSEFDEKMEELRDQMKKESVYIPRIAVETEYNIHWTLKELMDEIDQEFEYFRYKDLVIKKIKAPNMNRMKTDLLYAQTISSVIPRIQKDEMSVEEMKQVYKYLYKI